MKSTEKYPNTKYNPWSNHLHWSYKGKTCSVCGKPFLHNENVLHKTGRINYYHKKCFEKLLH